MDAINLGIYVAYGQEMNNSITSQSSGPCLLINNNQLVLVPYRPGLHNIIAAIFKRIFYGLCGYRSVSQQQVNELNVSAIRALENNPWFPFKRAKADFERSAVEAATYRNKLVWLANQAESIQLGSIRTDFGGILNEDQIASIIDQPTLQKIAQLLKAINSSRPNTEGTIGGLRESDPDPAPFVA